MQHGDGFWLMEEEYECLLWTGIKDSKGIVDCMVRLKIKVKLRGSGQGDVNVTLYTWKKVQWLKETLSTCTMACTT
jgi:hypothetical protein